MKTTNNAPLEIWIVYYLLRADSERHANYDTYEERNVLPSYLG